MSGKTISLPTNRRLEMDRPVPSAKSHKFPAGAVITINGITQDSYMADGKEQANDKLHITVSNAAGKDGKYILPVRELLKMETTEDSEALFSEEGENTLFPASFEIKASADREDREGRKVYPVQAYNAFEAQIEAGGGIDWNALVESDVKADNKLEPVQNYTVVIG